MAAKRVKRLKDLVGLLERLPASPDRDRVLSEVRSRAVDLDTGVRPRAMLPVRDPTPPPVLPQRAKARQGEHHADGAPAASSCARARALRLRNWPLEGPGADALRR